MPPPRIKLMGTGQEQSGTGAMRTVQWMLALTCGVVAGVLIGVPHWGAVDRFPGGVCGALLLTVKRGAPWEGVLPCEAISMKVCISWDQQLPSGPERDFYAHLPSQTLYILFSFSLEIPYHLQHFDVFGSVSCLFFSCFTWIFLLLFSPGAVIYKT